MPMTPEERNRRRREQYAAGKAAGLGRDQLRSARKAVEQAPDLMDVISNLFSGITKGFQDMVSDVAEAVGPPSLGEDKGRAPRSGGAQGSGGGSSSGSSSRGTGGSGGGGTPRKRSGGSGGGGKKPPSKPPAKTKPSAAASFKRFAKRELKKNPKASSRELEKKYKEKTGGKIGHKGAQAAIREVKGQAEKTPSKVTKFTEKIGEKEYSGTYRKGIKYFTPERNPQKKTYIKGKYMYLVKYGVEREGFAEPETNYITIASNRQLTFDEIKEKTMDAVGEGAANEKKKERYNLTGIREDSIEVMYAIDNRKK